MTVRDEVMSYLVNGQLYGSERTFNGKTTTEISKGVGRTYLQTRKVLRDLLDQDLVYCTRDKGGRRFFVVDSVLNEEVAAFLYLYSKSL